jgi:hypothetical protein
LATAVASASACQASRRSSSFLSAAKSSVRISLSCSTWLRTHDAAARRPVPRRADPLSTRVLLRASCAGSMVTETAPQAHARFLARLQLWRHLAAWIRPRGCSGGAGRSPRPCGRRLTAATSAIV